MNLKKNKDISLKRFALQDVIRKTIKRKGISTINSRFSYLMAEHIIIDIPQMIGYILLGCLQYFTIRSKQNRFSAMAGLSLKKFAETYVILGVIGIKLAATIAVNIFLEIKNVIEKDRMDIIAPHVMQKT